MAASPGGRTRPAMQMLLCSVLVFSATACEYKDEPLPSPPQGTQEPARQTNLEHVGKLLPPAPKDLAYAHGKQAEWSLEAPAGDYLFSAACAGSPGADIRIGSGTSPEETRSLSCGQLSTIMLQHSGGPLKVSVVPGLSAASTSSVDPAAAAAKLAPLPAYPGGGPDDGWVQSALGTALPGEVRGFLSANSPSGQELNAPPGDYKLHFACRGPGSVELAMRAFDGTSLLDPVQVICGQTFDSPIRLEHEGARVMVQPAGGWTDTSFGLIPLKLPQ